MTKRGRSRRGDVVVVVVQGNNGWWLLEWWEVVVVVVVVVEGPAGYGKRSEMDGWYLLIISCPTTTIGPVVGEMVVGWSKGLEQGL